MTPDERAAIRARCEAATAEEWRRVPGLEHYEVSDQGRVRSYMRRGRHREKTYSSPRLLRLVTAPRGYVTVSLPRGGSYRHVRVHTLVAGAFIGERPPGQEVAHLNGIPDDNRLANLAYVTHVANEAHKRVHGTDPVGERNGQAILTDEYVIEIRHLAALGIPQADIARCLSVHRATVSEVVSGKRWGHVRDPRSDVPTLLTENDQLRQHEPEIFGYCHETPITLGCSCGWREGDSPTWTDHLADPRWGTPEQWHPPEPPTP